MDRTTNQDVKNDMFIIIDDYLIEVFRNPGMKRGFDVIERITDSLIISKTGVVTQSKRSKTQRHLRRDPVG